jgi:polyisoprenoid-binding protein YceI
MTLLKTMTASVLVLIIFAAVRPAAANDYTLDDQHTSVVFAANHFGYSYTYGMFGRYKGDFSIDMNSPAAGKFQFAIDVASLDTKSAKRDEHLRGPDFFNVKQFPEITFQSTSIVADGKKLNVTGNLTLHGVEKQIVLPLTYLGAGKGPYGKERIGFYGSFKVKRSEFGITTFVPNVSDEVTLMISFEGLKQ